MKSKYLFVLLGIFFGYTQLFGQDLPQKKVKMKEMTKEIKQYQQENMLPIIQEQRKKLELALSNEDKKVIAEMRAALKEKNNQKFDERKYQKFDEKSKEMRIKMKEIATRNQTIIAQNFTPIEAKQTKWKEEIQGIQKKYISQEKNEEHQNHHFSHRKGKGELNIFLMPKNKRTDIGFLLFDYNQAIEQKSKSETNNKIANTLNVYPNPVKSVSNLSYELEKTSLVNINLINLKGENLKTLIKNENLNGKQTHEFNLSELEKGIYFYQINIDNQMITKKIVKE